MVNEENKDQIKKTAKEIRADDLIRLNKIKSAGYEIIVLWQNDIKNNTDYIKDLELKIKKIPDFLINYKIHTLIISSSQH